MKIDISKVHRVSRLFCARPRLPMAFTGICCCFLGLCMLLPAYAFGQALTLEESLSTKSAVSMVRNAVSSTKGRYVAWVDGGDLKVAVAPDFAPRTLVADGTIGKAMPSSDGRTIFYQRGSSQPAFGTLAAEDTRQLLQVAVEPGAQPRLVAAATEIPGRMVFAPDGKAFAFAEGPVLYEYRLSDAGQWKRRQLLQREPDHIGSQGIGMIAYSPDGARVAFTSDRKAGQRYVAIHDIAAGKTRYIDPGIYYDSLPFWSPDGSELAFVRSPSNLTMQYRFGPKLAGAPWSIVAADAASGAVRTVWKADKGPGSVRTSFSPVWTRDGRILFAWEKTGWQLLYAVSEKGGEPTLLTPGEGEVDDFALSPDERMLTYRTNIGDPARTHLWQLPLNGGQPLQLAPGQGMESAPRYLADGQLLYLSENRPQGPSQLVAREADGRERVLALRSAEAEQRSEAIYAHFVPGEVVPVRAKDGLVSYHIVSKPKSPPPPGGYPVVINSHGGPTMQTYPGESYVYAFGQYLASQGYLFVDMNYRGNTGFGLAYRYPEGRGATGGSEVKDIAALVDYLKQRGDVDPKRIGIMGSSYGGHMVGLAMTRLPDDFAAAVSLFGVADWVVEMKQDNEDEGAAHDPLHFIRLSERTRIEDLAFASSPTPLIDRWRAPTLLTEGDLDPQGHMQTTIDLGYQLLERGVPVEFYIAPAGGHNVFPEQKVFEFFEKTLRSGNR